MTCYSNFCSGKRTFSKPGTLPNCLSKTIFYGLNFNVIFMDSIQLLRELLKLYSVSILQQNTYSLSGYFKCQFLKIKV